jgi:hypothetical protein
MAVGCLYNKRTGEVRHLCRSPETSHRPDMAEHDNKDSVYGLIIKGPSDLLHGDLYGVHSRLRVDKIHSNGTVEVVVAS